MTKTKQQINDIYEALQALHSEEKRLFLPRFFKTGEGEYGEGDRFMGVVVPNIRPRNSSTPRSPPSRDCWPARGTRCANAASSSSRCNAARR